MIGALSLPSLPLHDWAQGLSYTVPPAQPLPLGFLGICAICLALLRGTPSMGFAGMTQKEDSSTAECKPVDLYPRTAEHEFPAFSRLPRSSLQAVSDQAADSREQFPA